MIGILQFYASQNFTNYVNKKELENIDDLITGLKYYFKENNGWGILKDNSELFARIIEETLPSPHSDKHAKPLFHGNFSDRPPMPPPPYDFERSAPNSEEPWHKPPPEPSEMKNMFISRLALLDENQNKVVGNTYAVKETLFREIEENNKIIGYVGLKKMERLSHPIDSGFLRQQFKVYCIIGFGVLLLSAIVSFLLSRHLLSPVNKLTDGTRDISSLKFNTRIHVNTTDELGLLADDFNRMAETLEKSERMRKQWILDISHELRTPLSILKGEIEALKDGIRDLNENAIDSLYMETAHISKIIDDLHLLSLADSDTLFYRKDPTHPVLVLIATIDVFRERYKQCHISIEENIVPSQQTILKGDSDRLIQMYSNIIENVLRYTKAPGTLTVRQKITDGILEIYFEDSGPGVPEASLPRLFDRLYRVDPSRSRQKGGSGLGLSICKNIAEAHGGRITAENSKKGGLIIKIFLPINDK